MSFKRIQKIKYLLTLIVGFSLLGTVQLAGAQSDVLIEIAKPTQQELRIAVPAFASLEGETDPRGFGKEGRSILENDLKLFELFEPVKRSLYQDLEERAISRVAVDYPSWNRLGVQWLIKTQYQVAANGRMVFIFRLYDIVNERFLTGKRYQGTPSWLRKMMHRFADEVMAQLTGKRGVAETQIGFLAQEGKNKELYVVDFDGYNPHKVTQEEAVVMSPDWAPDGRAIVFTSFRDRNPDLVMVDVSGRKRKVLLKLPGLNSAPAWSPDGEKIALVLSKDQNSEIYILDRFANLTRLTRHFNIDTSPTWSPDGKRIAFTSDRSGTGAPQIYVMDSRKGDGGTVKRLTFSSNYNDNPSWSPDGDRIAYTALVNGKFQIKIYDFETKKTFDLTTGSGDKESPVWSPDGRYVAYRMHRGKTSSVQIKRVGGKTSRSLTFQPLKTLSPTWSPYPRR